MECGQNFENQRPADDSEVRGAALWRDPQEVR